MSDESFGSGSSKPVRKTQTYRSVEKREEEIAEARKANFFEPADEKVTIQKDKYSQADREKMAKTGEAMPDGSFPIKDAEDLSNAMNDLGRKGNDPAVKAHIAKRARAMNMEDKLDSRFGDKTDTKKSVLDRAADALAAE